MVNIVVLCVLGMKKERKRQCTEACSKEGIAACKSAHLSPYDVASPSTCDLFVEDAYNHADVTSIRSAATGWSSFHIKVL